LTTHHLDAGVPARVFTGARWVGVGHSSEPDALVAGRSAARDALLGADSTAPKLLVVFCSDSYDLEQLLAGIAEQAPDVPLIGCSTAGEIGSLGAAQASVVVSAFGGDGFAAVTAAAADASSRLREAGEEVAEALSGLDAHPHRVAILLTDALGGDQTQVIRGAYSVFGATVPLVGGCAGDDFKLVATHQFHDGRVLSDTVVGAMLASDAPLGIGVHNGWRHVVGDPVLVTRSSNNRVYMLDDRPALDVYLERCNAPAAAYDDAEAFSQFAMTHPLGLGRRSSANSSADDARFVIGADFEERSLAMIAEVPEGGLAWFLEGDADSVLDATDAACSEAVTALGGASPRALLVVDCAARRLVLGEDGVSREVDRMAAHADGAPIAGFYSYGEIARARGAGGFHNQTLVVLAVS
jgi:hypothetical protein